MHNGCILCGGVGVGKTHCAVEYYLQNEAPKPVYVITTAKKRDKLDWQEVFIQVGISENAELTMGSVLKVDSWENIKKYEEVTDAFFIFDEQRLVGTGAWVKAFYKIAAANRWIMLSATPGDNWLDYVPVFRANGFIKNITQFKEEHVISRWTGRYYQVTGYRQVSKLVRWRNQLLVDMPYEKHTKRHTHYVQVDYDKETVKDLVTRRWHVYEDRPLTDASELFRVTRKVVYSDTSRLRAVESLLQKHPKLIVFYNFDYELDILRTLAQTPNVLKQDDVVENVSVDSWNDSTSSSTQSSETSASTKSPTPSGSESNADLSIESLTDLNSTDPWDYLLSPEGMRENNSLINSSDSKSVLTSNSRIESSSSSEQMIQSESESSQRLGSSSTNPLSSVDPTDLAKTQSSQSSKRSEFNPESGTPSPNREGHWTKDFGLGEIYVPRVCPTTDTLMSLPEDQEDPNQDLTRKGSTSPSGTTNGSRAMSTTRTRGMKSSSRGSGKSSSLPSASPATRLMMEETTDSGMSTHHQADGPDSFDGSGGTEWTNQRGFLQQHQKSSLSSELAIDTLSDRLVSAKSSESVKKSITLDSLKTSSEELAQCLIGRKSGPMQPFQVAEWNGHKHQEVPTSTSWVYLVQYVAGAEAWECTETDAMVFFSLPYSYKVWWQAHGRIDRLTTTFADLHYYVLWAGSYLEKGVRTALKHKKSFNESAFGAELGLF